MNESASFFDFSPFGGSNPVEDIDKDEDLDDLDTTIEDDLDDILEKGDPLTDLDDEDLLDDEYLEDEYWDDEEDEEDYSDEDEY